jgi:hypothetical protein
MNTNGIELAQFAGRVQIGGNKSATERTLLGADHDIFPGLVGGIVAELKRLATHRVGIGISLSFGPATSDQFRQPALITQ